MWHVPVTCETYFILNLCSVACDPIVFLSKQTATFYNLLLINSSVYYSSKYIFCAEFDILLNCH